MISKVQGCPTSSGNIQSSTALPAGQMRFENPLDELVIHDGAGWGRDFGGNEH